MKLLIVYILTTIILCTQVLAISPINMDSIKAAHAYGKENAQIPLQEFLYPWMAYEEKVTVLSSGTERAYLYTPFLLMATDSREKHLDGQGVTIQDSEKVLSDYAGTLSLSVFLLGEDPEFNKNCSVIFKQGEKVIKPYQVIIPSKTETNHVVGTKGYSMQCYFYFYEKEIDVAKPVYLIITTGDKKEHRFYFDLDKLK